MMRTATDSVTSALRRYLEASSLAEARDVLEQHVELLDEELTNHAAEIAVAAGEARIRWALLARAQAIGIGAAFAEVAPGVLRRPRASNEPAVSAAPTEPLVRELLASPSFMRTREILESHPELLTAEALDLLDDIVARAQHDRSLRRSASATRVILEASRTSGLHTVVRLLAPRYAEPFGDLSLDRRGILERLGEFIAAETWAESRRVAEGHPEMYAEGFAELGFEILAAQVAADGFPIEPERRLLRRCRELGIEAAFDTPEYWDAGAPPVPDATRESEPQSAGRAAAERLWRSLRDPASVDLAQAAQMVLGYLQGTDLPPTGQGSRQSLLLGLALLYSQRNVTSDSHADLERSLSSLDEALRVARSTNDQLQVDILKATATALVTRYNVTGRLADLERAVDAGEEALRLARWLTIDWTGAATGLAFTLEVRFRGTNERADLQRAILLLESAERLQPFHSLDRLTTLSSLAEALWNRYLSSHDSTDLERCIASNREVIALASKWPEFASARPSVLGHLGDALMGRYLNSHNVEDLVAAADAAQRALDGTPEYSALRAQRLAKVADALRITHTDLGQEQALERAISLAMQAAKTVASGSPDEFGVLSSLGLALEAAAMDGNALAETEDSTVVWERVVSLIEARSGTLPVAYRIGQQARHLHAYGHLIAALSHAAEVDPEVAGQAGRRIIEVVEATKSRLLAQRVGRAGPPPATVPVDKAARERALLARLEQLDTGELSTYGGPGQEDSVATMSRLAERQSYQQGLAEVWDDIAALGSEAATYVAMRRGEPARWDDLAALANRLGPATGLISGFSSPAGTVFLVLRAGWDAPLIIRAALKGSNWTDALRRLYREVHIAPGRQVRSETWHRGLQPALAKAAEALGAIERLVISPYGPGHLVPWAALAHRVGWVRADGQPLSVVTLPALSVLSYIQRRPRAAHGRALVIGNPTGDLAFADAEATVVADVLGTEALAGARAAKADVLARISHAETVHLASHAAFVPGEPLESGVQLADGVLTAREVMQRHLQADLVVLSACDTGQSEALAGDELAGLAQAFLYAGARSLIVSLWPVNDTATAALMVALYESLARGADKGDALARAMADVRGVPRFSHPHYWSPFVLMGDW
jgi:hypothetical protein